LTLFSFPLFALERSKTQEQKKGQTSTSRIKVEVESAKKKREKSREVKTLRNSSSKPGTWKVAKNTE
jgi:hypothetical protein